MTSGSSARSVSEKIRNTYPIDYVSGQSDTASRVRKKLCDFFQTSKEYASFFKCTQNDETLGQLFLSMSRLWQGNAWLGGLINAIDEERVVVTSRQKMFLIQAFPPKKQKGPFSFW